MASFNINAQKTQKVILLYGDFTYKKGDGEITITNEKNVLKIPVKSIISGANLFGDVKQDKYQGSLLLRGDGKLASQVRDFLKTGKDSRQGVFNANSWGINPPPCPPGQPECPPKAGLIAHFFETNLGSPIEVISLPAN